MPYPLPLTRTEAYLAYKAGVIQQSDLKPSLAVPRNGIDAWLAYWTGLANYYPIKNLGKNIIDYAGHLNAGSHDGLDVSLDDATGQITVSGQPTRGYAKIVSTYDITNLLEDGKEYTISQSAYDNKMYAQVNATTAAGTPVYIYSFSGAKTFTVDKSTYPHYSLVIQTGEQSAWTAPQTITRTFQIEKGSSASAFEPYTGEPLILQEEEAYIAYLCGVINEYPEKCLRRVGAYLRYLISARLGRPDHPLNREELYLSLIKTQFIPSGDPSSDIEIDGTAKAPFVDVKMYGDTEQVSYTGKNLIGFTPMSQTIGSLTVSVDENNIITVNGTSASSGTTHFNNLVGKVAKLPNDIAISYKIISGTYSSADGYVGLAFRDSEAIQKAYIQSRLDFTNVSGRVTGQPINNDWTIRNIDTTSGSIVSVNPFVIQSGATYNNLKIQIQAVAGTTQDFDFEPYVGGIASPSPEYPQEVKTVTGRQTVSVVGKNLFNLAKIAPDMVNSFYPTTATGRITYTDNSIVLSSDIAFSPNFSAGSAKQNEDFYTTLDKNTDYTFSFTGTNVTIIGYAYDQSTNRHVKLISDTDRTVSTFNSGNYDNLIVRFGKKTSGSPSEYSNIQLEKSSAATAYEPYSSNDYDINLGKNLIDANNTTIYKCYLGNVSIRMNNNGNSLLIPVNAGETYTISRQEATGTAPAVGFINDIPREGLAWSNRHEFTSSELSYTAVAPSGYKYMLLYFAWSTASEETQRTYLLQKQFQIERGDKATSYAPYFEPIKLCKLGTYQDRIYKDGDAWKIEKHVKSVVLRGTETWYGSALGTVNARFTLTVPDIALQAYNLSAQDVTASDYFGSTTWYKLYTSFTSDNPLDNVLCSHNSIHELIVRGTSFATIDELKSWLASNTPTVYYASTTPSTTTITYQPLINQLEALVKGGAENGTTYIKASATGHNLPGLLYVEAPKYV